MAERLPARSPAAGLVVEAADLGSGWGAAPLPPAIEVGVGGCGGKAMAVVWPYYIAMTHNSMAIS